MHVFFLFIYKYNRCRSTRYVLIKLLRADHESENMDVQYIGFVGYTGARAFIDKKLF
jgi:hypothetical protein